MVTLLGFLAVWFHATTSEFPGWKAIPFPLSRIELHQSSKYGQVQQHTLNYLLTLDSTRLVCLYLLAANISKTCEPYSSWGEFVGHWLSSSSTMYSNTGNATLQTKMNGIIDQLSNCEEAWRNVGYPGYLYWFSPVEFEILEEQINGTLDSEPFYDIHKVMAGLIDQYIHANSTNALNLVKKMGDWVTNNVDSTISRIGINGWQNVLNTEWGGMNEVLYNLYNITSNINYLRTANYFDHYSFTRPLALNIDDLSGLHANTHIPEIAGSARGYEVNGNETQKIITINFFNILNKTRTFSTGGSNDHEYWGNAYYLGDQMNDDTEESCTQYNILKVTRYMYSWNGASLLMDYYERAILNGLIGNLNMNKPEYFYMNPLGGGGLVKPWGDAYENFYCCWGTLTESFGKLSDSIYFKSPNNANMDTPKLFINQYIASTLNWNEYGIIIKQDTNYPINNDGSTTKITINLNKDNEFKFNEFIISLRVPWWTRVDDVNNGAYVKINGKSINNSLIIPSTYLNLNIKWNDGDVIDVKFPMFPRWEYLKDNRTEWQSVGAFMYGPILLAGMTNSVYFNFDLNKIEDIIHPKGDGSNEFIATDINGNNMTMIPQMDIINEVYTIYFKNGQPSVLPYNVNGSTLKISSTYDMDFAGGADIMSNPSESIRSGDPTEISNATAMTSVNNKQHNVQNVELDFQYICGYGGNGVGIGANFTLYMHSNPYINGQTFVIYKSPHFTNYSYDECNTCYSPPIRIKSADLNINVSNEYFVFEFVFQNNDRNIQLLLKTLNITVFWI